MTGPSRSHADAADLPVSQETSEDRPRSFYVDPEAAPPEAGGKKPRSIAGWWWAAVPLALGTVLTLVARLLPQRVDELYSRGLYPKIGGFFQGLAQRWTEVCGATNGDLSARRPSLSEAMIGLALGVLIVVLIRAGSRGIGAFVRRVIWLGGAAYLAFLLCWGLNHSRIPLGESLGLAVTDVSVEELNNVALELERDLSYLLMDDPSLGSAPPNAMDIGRAALVAWSDALRRDPRLGWQPEATLCAPALSSALVASGISGIFSPFSQEAHVAFGLPEVDLAFSACHEIAHVQGWAREDEANYLAWRVASRSDSPVMRKAALTLALVHVHHALRKADPVVQQRRAMSMDVRVVALLQERSRFWSKKKSRVASRAVGAVNNTYLKSQGHAGGVASYGRMVDLLVAELR